MQKPIYSDAVQEITVKNLSDFLKTVDDLVEITGWSKLRAPEKRSQFIDALSQSPEMRQRFVKYYGEITNQTVNWADWEAGSAPTSTTADDTTETPAETPAEDGIEDATVIPDETAETPAPAPTGDAVTILSATSDALPSHFVEGAYDTMKADAAGLNAEQSASALRVAEENLEFEHLKIGVLLSHITNSQHYMTLGYENMQQYFDAETTIGYRKGMQLIKNAERIGELNIPATQLKGVTWSALRHVLPVLDEKNYKTWLDAARSMKHIALIDAVKQQKETNAAALPKPDPAKPETHQKPKPKTFQLFEDQTAVVNSAIEKAKLDAGVETTGAALEVMAASYSGKPTSASTNAAGIPDVSDAGIKNLLSKLRAEEGNDGLIRLLNAVGEVWPEPDISVDLKG